MTKTCPDCDATVHSSLAATPAVGGETDEHIAMAMYDWQYGAGAWASSQSHLKDHFIGLARAAIAAQPALRGRDINETSRDWDICRAVDLYRAPRNEGDERTLSDFLVDVGLVISASPPEQPAADPVMGREALDRAAFQLFLLDNNASRWPSVNQGHYRKEAKSILDAALAAAPGEASWRSGATPAVGGEAPWRAAVDLTEKSILSEYYSGLMNGDVRIKEGFKNLRAALSAAPPVMMPNLG